MSRTVLQIEAVYSNEAHPGVEHTTYRHNKQQTFNIILV